jgi:3-hydroxyisobutyrate dehydrogenase-like beta-hydroxyacid dehydrogenase
VTSTIVGLLHPGAMGATIGAACRADVRWCAAGRSAASSERAQAAGLRPVATLGSLIDQADVIVSVCPPDRAGDVARSVAGLGFVGVYVDANAIAPSTAREIGEMFDRFVDGGIIGPPAERAGTTRLYLSGDDAATVTSVADLWSDSALDARVIDGGPGAASAVKTAYATWTKVSGALLLDVRALARAEGVEDALLAEWAISQPGTAERSVATARGVSPKAWRFAGEMEQIATAFRDAGLPAGFADGANEIYRRLADYKDDPAVDPDEVVRTVLERGPVSGT